MASSVIYDLGDGPNPNHVGIRIRRGDIALHSLSNTVVGGAHGLYVDAPVSIEARNNLFSGATASCYGLGSSGGGSTWIDCSHNLSSDDSAPGEDAVHDASVTFAGATGGDQADLHLSCGLAALHPIVTQEGLDEANLDDLFDGDVNTIAQSAGVNPVRVQYELAEPVTFTGTSGCFAEGDNEWMVEVADQEDEFDTHDGGYRLIVPWRTVPGFSWSWDRVELGGPVTARYVRLTVHNLNGDDASVLINEWHLDGWNPACGVGEDLTGDPERPVLLDVDSVAPAGPFDIGADQTNEVLIGFESDWYEVWEGEGAVSMDVMLSAPAPLPVMVRYRTWDNNAVAGDDYAETAGALLFPAGVTHQTVTVPVIDDGPGEDDETFHMELYDPAGVRLRHGWTPYPDIFIHESDVPPRASLASTSLEVDEDAGIAWVDIALDKPVPGPDSVWVYWNARDGSALTGLDFRQEGGSVEILPGETGASVALHIVNDDLSEPDETVRLALVGGEGVAIGTPRTGVLTIHDDDSGPPLEVFLARSSWSVEEGAGQASVEVRLSRARSTVVTVHLATADGSAQAGEDYQQLDELVTFPVGSTFQLVPLVIVDDDQEEGSETLTVSLSNPSSGVPLAEPSSAVLTIWDDDGEVNELDLSVRPGDDGNLLGDPVTVTITNGEAVFTNDLPDGPDRGDRLQLEDGSSLYLRGCVDCRNCQVVTGTGVAPSDLGDVQVTGIYPAFSALADAVSGADAIVGTKDLVAAGVSLNLVCYAGDDYQPVSISGWTTSPRNLIRIVAPLPYAVRGASQRHPGRWEEDYSYTLEAYGTCITSDIGDLRLEGLQLACWGDPDEPLLGLDLAGSGRTEISESLVWLDGRQDPDAERIGIRAGGSVDLEIRNVAIADVGQGEDPAPIGVQVSSPDARVALLSSTIVGGTYGVDNTAGGTVIAVDTLAVDAATSCFEGSFDAASHHDLSSDDTAPGAEATHSARVVFADPTEDLHLACGVLDQQVTITRQGFAGSTIEDALQRLPGRLGGRAGRNEPGLGAARVRRQRYRRRHRCSVQRGLPRRGTGLACGGGRQRLGPRPSG